MNDSAAIDWSRYVSHALTAVDTPCYVAAWRPIQAAVDTLHAIPSTCRVRSWLSFKTHPLPALADQWRRCGWGVEVVSEAELATLLNRGYSAEQILINGVAKHAWLHRYPLSGLRVQFDSLAEIEALLPLALSLGWRVGVRCHVPGERDVRAPSFGGQFGMTRVEAVAAFRLLKAAGADVHSVHFHLGQAVQAAAAYTDAMHYVADVCAEAEVSPPVLDCGGGLPSASDVRWASAFGDLINAIRQAPARFGRLQEVWLENGRFVSEGSTALAVRVLDIKERDECRYVICDGGRTNQALAADHQQHALLTIPSRGGPTQLTTVCGPTCMTDDRLGRWELSRDVAVGDVLVWLDAGAYHLPWETRFSHGLCAIAWYDAEDVLTIVRAPERAGSGRWIAQEVLVRG